MLGKRLLKFQKIYLFYSIKDDDNRVKVIWVIETEIVCLSLLRTRKWKYLKSTCTYHACDFCCIFLNYTDKCNSVPPNLRTDCGYLGINEKTCKEERGCCYDSKNYGYPTKHCFYDIGNIFRLNVNQLSSNDFLYDLSRFEILYRIGIWKCLFVCFWLYVCLFVCLFV